MAICSLGHIARTRDLRAAGFTRARLERALARRTVVRLQRGTYACAHVSAPRAAAARIGGALSCVSVLREHRIWAGHDSRVHVQLSPRSSAAVPHSVRAHREWPRFAGGPWEVSRLQALWQAIHCLDTENAFAAMESAIRRDFLSETAVRALAAAAPRRLRALIPLLISNSGSGNESIVRLRLVRAGYPVVAQARVPGLGRQDLLVDDVLAIEVDSREWHGDDDQLALDIERDLVSVALGRPVIRIRPTHIHDSWERTRSIIDRAVRDARRR
jgi:hypothetical protein